MRSRREALCVNTNIKGKGLHIKTKNIDAHRYRKHGHTRALAQYIIVSFEHGYRTAYARVCMSPVAVFDACRTQFASCQS